jgi:hypothetical protein
MDPSGYHLLKSDVEIGDSGPKRSSNLMIGNPGKYR